LSIAFSLIRFMGISSRQVKTDLDYNTTYLPFAVYLFAQ
jgi:hypothetical protein